MSERIDDGDFWKAKAMATNVDLMRERAQKAMDDFQAHLSSVHAKYKIREGVDRLNDDGSITRGPTDEEK